MLRSVRNESGNASAGIVIRDSNGKVFLTAWRVLRDCAKPEQAEAEACLEGLWLAAEWVRQPAWVESDCLNLINDIHQTNSSRSGLLGVLAEIKAVKNILPECHFKHIKRCANEVAHRLAQEAIRNQNCIVMRFNAPECVRGLLAKEEAGIDATPPFCNLSNS
jgi:ribonuclease HI